MGINKIMTDTNQTFKSNESKTEPELAVSASLDLTDKPLGNFYFNKENNFNYEKNWFSYPNFQSINEELIISEVVQYAQPNFVPNTLDSSKVYQLPSTTMFPNWGTRIETGFLYTPINMGYSSTDSFGNVYVIANYARPPASLAGIAVVYNANNTTAFSQTTSSTSVCIAKYNSNGVCQWAARIRGQTNINSVQADYCVTDNAGTTYIVGGGSGNIEFVNGANSTTYTVNVSSKTWLVAYDTNGNPDWVTYFEPASYKTYLWVDNQTIGNVYVTGGRTFYDNILSSPVQVMKLPDTADFSIAKFRSSSGLFQWATFLDSYRLSNWRNLNDFSNQSMVTDSKGNLYLTGYYTQITNIYDAPRASSVRISLIRRTTNVATITTTVNHQLLTGQLVSIDCITNTSFNALNVSITVTSSTTFTYSNSGSDVVLSVGSGTVSFLLFPTSVDVPPYSSPIVWVPRDTNRNWSAVDINAYGDRMITAVDYGYIYTSTNGISWNQQASPQRWSSVFINEKCAIATAYGSVIFRSLTSDLMTDMLWEVSTGEGSNARKWTALGGTPGITNNRIIMAGYDDYGASFAYSDDDGITWSRYQDPLASGPGNTLGIASNGKQRWVAVGQTDIFTGSHTIAYSNDGINWTGLGKTIFSVAGFEVAWNGSIWVAVGEGSSNTIAYSTDGVTWVGLGKTIFNVRGRCVAWNGSMWMAGGEGLNTIAYSTNGITWTGLGTSNISIGKGVAWSGKRWVIVGHDGVSINNIAFSDDGINWTKRVIISPSPILNLTAIAHNGLYFIAVGQGTGTTGPIVYSLDGTTWSFVTQTESTMLDILWTGTKWITAGSSSVLSDPLYSTDGFNWEPLQMGFTFGAQAVASNFVNKQVATALNDKIFYTISSGSIWLSTNSPIANWVDIAYDNTSSNYMAVATGSRPYYSPDGINWFITSGPIANWTAISGKRAGLSTSAYAFYATIQNGDIYGANSTGSIWTILDSTDRNYTDIAAAGSTIFATVYDGSIYQSIDTVETTWTPTTIPRNWYRIASSGNGNTSIAVVQGGQIFVAQEYYPTRHAFLLKYDSDGVCQWATYVNCEDPEVDNVGISLTCQSNGNVILGGWNFTYPSSGPQPPIKLKFYSPTDFDYPVKDISTTTDSFLACYSPNGMPLWVNTSTFENSVPYSSLCVDESDNIYCIGQGNNVYLYNPDMTITFTSVRSTTTGVLVKYYPNGYVQSFTRIEHPSSNTYGQSINVSNNNIYISGISLATTGSIVLNTSPGNISSVSIPLLNNNVYIAKYSSNDSSCVNFPNVGYNTVFMPRFSIGGSSREIINNSGIDLDIELWGGQTGFTPATIDSIDANTGVILYLGHEPGYTIPIEDGLLSENTNKYRVLTAGIIEPSFPKNDVQPVRTGTIPYGYLLTYVNFPSYTMSIQFNNNLNDQSSLILSANGIIPSSGLLPTGVNVGDVIRILVSNTDSKYVYLTVKKLIATDIVTSTHAGIMFEESTQYLSNNIGPTTGVVIMISLFNNRYVPIYYRPNVIQQGKLNVSLILYPKQQL